MGWISTTFTRTGEASAEAKARLVRVVEKHRPAMDKVIEEFREYVKQTKKLLGQK